MSSDQRELLQELLPASSSSSVLFPEDVKVIVQPPGNAPSLQWQVMQQTLSLMVAPCAAGRSKIWPVLDVEDMLGESPSKQLLLQISYLSLESISKGDWRIGIRRQLASGFTNTVVDVTGRVVSNILFTPITTTAAAASVGLACALPAAVFQTLALVSASHLSKHINQAIQKLRLDVSFLQHSVSKGLLAEAVATAAILCSLHQELQALLKHADSSTPDEMDYWVNLLWKRLSSCALPLQSARFTLLQRLDALTQEVFRLAEMQSTDVDMPLAHACFDKTMELAQYLYVVAQSFQVYAAVVTFFVQLRQPDLLQNVAADTATDEAALRAAALQLRDIAATLGRILREKSAESGWLSRKVWNRHRYQDLLDLLDMTPTLRQNCKLAAGEASELRFFLTQLPNGKVGVKLLEDDDPLLIDSSPALGPLWSEAPSPPTTPRHRLNPPCGEDLHTVDPASEFNRVVTVRTGEQTAPAPSPAGPLETVDVQQLRAIFGPQGRPHRVQTTLGCMLALTTGGKVVDGVVYNAFSQKVGRLMCSPKDDIPVQAAFPYENVGHAVAVTSPHRFWQVCATLTGHAHLHGMYAKLKEVELSAAGLVSDVEAEVLGRLQGAEHELCRNLHLVQQPDADPLTTQHLQQQGADVERRILRDMHYVKSIADVCLWACCEEANATALHPEKLQILLSQFQFLWHAQLWVQRCCCIQALVEIHACAAHVPQRLPVVFARLQEHDKALAHCIGVLHTVSSYLQQVIEDGVSHINASRWRRLWNRDTKRKTTQVADLWRQVCTEFGQLGADIVLDPLPGGGVQVAVR